jgi:predicted GTPase
VYSELIDSALRELSDERTQTTLWCSEGGSEVSSLTEAISRLWDDSGLGDAMERGVVFDEAIDDRLRRLQQVLDILDESSPPPELLASPQLGVARSLATELLEALRDTGYGRAGA